MKKYNGGEKVKSGFYFSFREKDFIDLANDFEALPGGDQDTYVRIPSALMILAGPLLGLLYVIFLPLISFVMLLHVIGKQVRVGLLHLAGATWRPGFAYFAGWRHSGKNKEKQVPLEAEPEKSSSDLLDELEKEIADRRKEGEK